MDNTIQKIEQLYQSKGYNLTSQRKAITIELLKSKKRHLSCGEIYNLVKSRNSSIGLSTVYRAIAILEEIGVLKKAYIDDDKSVKYEVCTNYENENHFHLICKKCGSVIEVKDEGIDVLSQQIKTNYKFEVKEQRANFFGICNNCLRGQMEEKLKRKTGKGRLDCGE